MSTQMNESESSERGREYLVDNISYTVFTRWDTGYTGSVKTVLAARFAGRLHDGWGRLENFRKLTAKIP